MREGPLVSVMMPCFNASETLPMAVASLTAQTHQNWEAVIVDDGSTDDTWRVLQSFEDPRLRCERFERNRGRGAARQHCLQMANGDYLAFLDSDDWLFPEKLAHETKILNDDPELAIVSTATVITDGPDHPVGLSRSARQDAPSLHHGTFRKPGPPPLEFPPSMIRMEVAKSGHFDPAFLRSQDSDFLIRILLGKRYAVSAEPLYAYSQASAATLAKTLEGYRFRLRSYARYWGTHPLTVAQLMVQTLGRMAAYRLAGAVNQENRLIARRWQPLTQDATRKFEQAFEKVSEIAQSFSVGTR